MRKRISLFALVWLISLAGAMADDYLMPQYGYETKTVSKDNPVTFYDFKGASTHFTQSALSTVIFQPATSGYSIKITFEELNLTRYSASYDVYMRIYNGQFDVTSITYPTSGNPSVQFPENANQIAYIPGDGAVNPLPTYISGAADGCLSVCLYSKDPSPKESYWKATVTEVLLESMTVESAAANYDFVDTEVWAGKQNAGMAGMTITTEGYSSPDQLQSLTFTANGTGVIDPTALQLYAGQAASTAGMTALAGTITESAGVYTYTLTESYALSNGNNKFMLAGDILSSATFNTTAQVNITGITTVGGFTSFTTATPATLTVEPMFFMTNGETIDANVSQTLTLYDDGGATGKISNNFEGTAIFRPVTAGKKVMIDLRDVDIFYTSSAVGVGNQDILQVYAGAGTNGELLWEMTTDATVSQKVIHSTSADGCLTVYLKSKAPSTYYQGNGFTAYLSEFTPEAMTVAGISTEKDEEDVAAGQTNMPLFTFTLTTVNTEPALVIDHIEFAITNETLVSSVVSPTNVTLKEGENTIEVKVNIAAQATTGNSFTVTAQRIHFTNGTTYAINQSATKTIQNIIYSTEGTHTYTIFDEWQFTHTPLNEYSDNYATGTSDQITILKPSTAGNLIQLDFSAFKVYYSYYKAKFEVYDGEGTSGTKLYEVSNSETASTLPPTLRSTSGALTVVFNPNTSYSSYISTGWEASVTEYTPKNMAVTDVTVEQASTRLVSLGEEKAALLNVNIQTEGTLSPLTLDAMTVSLKGTEANVSTVYLLQGSTVLAQASAAATTVLTLTTPVTLNEYDNEFSIAVDIKADATVEQTVDAALLSLTISDAAQSVSAGDPTGERTIKNVYCLQAGDNGTKQIGATSLMFYDDGGADGTYTKNIEGYVTFVPEHEGYAVEVLVNNYKLSSSAPVKIYYGASHDGDADATVEYNYSDPEKYKGQSFISSAADGSLTVYFKDQSYGSANDGWEFEVREHLLTDLSVESVTATSIASAMQTVGAKDLKMLQIAVVVTGDRTPLTVDAINVVANEYTDGTKLYQTGKVATFSDSEPFAAPYAISERGTYYFWVTADASEDADDDDVMTVSLSSIQSGSATITPTTAETAQTTLAHGMSGVYYIGQYTSAMPTDFATVAEAKEAMATLGIEGNVTFNIVPGNYSEKVTLDAVNGTSSAATVTFQSATGNAADVVFASDETGDTEGVWTINGTDWLTLKNMTFKSDKTGYAACLVLKNQSQHVTVDGCVLTTAVTGNSTSQNMQLVRVISEDADNANCNYFTVENSTFIGGYHALNLTQGSYASHPYRSDYIVRNNTFRGQEKLVIYTNFMNNLTVENNTISMTNVTSTDARAMDIRGLSGHYVIAGNNITIQCTSTGYSNAIYFATSGQNNCAEGTIVDIYNNAVYVETSANSASSCVRFKWQREVNMSYNTLVVNGTYSTTSALWLENFNNLQLTATNNLIQNIGMGNAIFGVKGTYSHNALYSASGNINNSNASFEAWKTAVSATDADANLNEQAVFASNSLLILKEAGSLVSATPIATITTDIDGKERAAIPTIGAYEYDAEMLNIPVMAEGYPKAQNIQDITADIAVKADNKGTAKVLVVAATEAAPAKETVLADGREVVLQKDAEATVTIDALTEETEYKAYVLLLSPIGEAADAVVVTEAFTTAWTLRPVQVTAIAAQTVEENADVTLTATLVNEYEQAKPYTYKWYTAYDETEIGNGATLNTTATRTTEYICCVTDRFNQKGYVSAHVKVTKAATAATFEEYNLPAGGNKYVDDAWADGVETYLYSGTYAFANTPNKAYNAFNGYVISADQSNVATGNYMTDQFRSAAGGAYEGNNFAVAYYAAPSTWFAGYNDPVTLTNTTEPQVINGFYITNSAYTMDAILHGDYANDAFAQGDYLSLTISGYNGTTKTGETTFYLADYRSANASEHYALDTWKWLDLSGLGAVTRLEFTMFTTKSDEYGFTTPTYFCLDNFGGEQEQEGMYIDVTEGQWGTLCLPYDLAADGHNGLEVFHSDYLNTDDNRLYLLEETGVYGKGLPMVYHALTTGRVYLRRASSEDTDTNVAGEENGFHASFEGMAAGTLTGKYVINPADNNVYKCSATAWIRPNRCYWDDIMSASFPHATNYPSAAPARRRTIGAGRPGNPTGLEDAQEATTARKFIENGQLYILRDGHLYNAEGQIIR
ncbi:MAG: DUF4465 domain-containing protein [Paludibacteraceae bacterium]|nr:DUF4465 domain-containing protein [Paludibacteraceae bacterium]